MFEDTADSFLNITDHLLDEDDMASDSDTAVPTQQSVKAYVDGLVLSGGAGGADLSTRIFEDFDIGATGYMSGTAFNNGGGLGSAANSSTVGEDSTEKANGVLSFSTSNSTGGGASWNSSSDVVIGFGCQHTITFRMSFSDLSDGTDTFTIRLGFLDTFVGSESNGAFFRYTHGTNSGKWQAVTKASSVETAEDTGITAEADVYHRFTVVIYNDGSQVDFYIDDVKTNDITTNIPANGNVCAMIQKTAGSTARLMYLDYYEKQC